MRRRDTIYPTFKTLTYRPVSLRVFALKGRPFIFAALKLPWLQLLATEVAVEKCFHSYSAGEGLCMESESLCFPLHLALVSVLVEVKLFIHISDIKSMSRPIKSPGYTSVCQA